MRDFWRNCLYGRQLYPGDYHVVPVTTHDVIVYLKTYGFENIKSGPEGDTHEGSTILKCSKGKTPLTKSQVFRERVFAK